MTNFRSVASVYNPDLLSKDQLIDNYVVRLKKFDKLFADIKTADMEKPEQHLMLVGLRGMGKTTLLRRLAYEVENDPGLNTWLVPIIFNEEEYGINQLFKLWETIAKYLEKRDVAFVGLFSEMDQSYTRLKDDVHRYEQEAFELLLERLHQHQKKLLLFIDNFGDMFKRFTKKNEKQRLREILMTCADLRIIAASAVVMEAFFKYDDPLYEFFKIERLEGLDFEETKTLLLKLGAHIPDNPIQKIIDEQPQRIEALRRLTGGIPRSMVLFFDIFIKDKDGTALTDLEKILDYVTPLYKQRMDDLPSQQQDIMQTLALNYDGMSAREIADRTRLSSKLVSAQLNQLQKDNLVSVANEGSKNHIYHVYDRFFNIWFLMRMARSGDKNRILWLVRFLEAWCTPEDLAKRSEAHRDAMAMTFYDPRAAYTFSSALYYADNQDIGKRYLMARRTQDYLRYSAPDLFEQSKTSDLGFFGRGVTAMKLHNWEEAYQELVGIKEKNMQDYLLLYVLEEIRGNKKGMEMCLLEAHQLNKSKINLKRIIGWIYLYINNLEQAKAYLSIAIELNDVEACKLLGGVYELERDFVKAEYYYHKAIERGDPSAFISLGDLFCYSIDDQEKAKEFYKAALEKGQNESLVHLGELYAYKQKNYLKVKEYFEKASKLGNSNALIRLGRICAFHFYEYEDAEDYFEKAVENGSGEAWHALGKYYQITCQDDKAKESFYRSIELGYTSGWLALGELYHYEIKDYNQAEKYYLKSNESGIDAWLQLGRLYSEELERYSDAEKCYLNGISNEPLGCFHELITLYRHGLKNNQLAIEYCEKIIKTGESNYCIVLGDIYCNDLNDYGKAEESYLKAVENKHPWGWQRLGELYAEKLSEMSKAEYYFEQALKEGVPRTYQSLFRGYICTKQNSLHALKRVENTDTSKEDLMLQFMIAFIYLWNEKYSKALEIFENSLNNKILIWEEKAIKSSSFNMLQLFILLLSKSQYEFLYNYFTSKQGQSLQLKDYLLPIYYALMHYLKDEYPQEYLRTPPELKETVQEIMDKVEEYRIAYQLPPEEAATA